MNAVGYSSPFVPAELIAAHGLRPHRLRLHATEKVTRGVCPYAGALLDAALQPEKGTGTFCPSGPSAGTDAQRWSSHKRSLSPFPLWPDVSALVLTTVCDQMRYVAAILEQRGGRPVFLLNVPSTWQTPAARQLYRDEIGRLGRFLVRLGGRAPNDEDLSRIMLDFDRARSNSEGEKGTVPFSPARASGQSPAGIPLAVIGGPLLETGCDFFELVERAGGRVVLDATEGGERTLPRPLDPARVATNPLEELADAYFDGIPDVFRRPNTALYDWLGRELATRHVRGIILRRYVWCDLWHAELQRLKEWSPAPVLEIDVGPDDADPSRVQGRIEAFLETLR